jgi:FixJ family two-component response regulator
MTEQPFTVAIVDDDASFSEAIVWLLRGNGYDVRHYGDACSFLDRLDMTAIGCALVDLRLEGDNGIEVFKAAYAKGFDMPVIMISGHGDIPSAVRAVQEGAMGFIEKPIDNDKLLAEVATACSYHRDICSRYGRAVDAIRLYGQLTEREQEVFWLLVGGKATKEIATILDISTRTAEVHRSRVFEKMRTRKVASLIDLARHLSPEPHRDPLVHS